LTSLSGFAAGFAQHPDSSRADFVANFYPSDVTLNFDATTNTMTGSLKVGAVNLSSSAVVQALLHQDLNKLLNPGFNLEFGGPGRSAFIDDNDFAAIEATGGSTVTDNYVEYRRGPFGIPIPQAKSFTDTNPEVQGFLVSADAIQANQILFPGQTVQTPNGPQQKRAFCQDCDYIKWGAWGARVDYQQHNSQTATADVPLGWWIAGDVISSDDMPKTGNATYMGDAIGNVINSGKQYTATGDMSLMWYFASRSGTLTISKFDTSVNNGQGIKFSGPMLAPGAVAFNGPLSSSALGGLVGEANGMFVGHGGPQGVIGNFGIGNPTYQATGIFGGMQTSYVP
jgi:hypothetical protein